MNEIKTVLSAIGDYFTSADWFLMAKWPFWILLFTVAAGGVYTARFGKKTLLCKSICGTLNLLAIYQTAVILYAAWPLLRELPFGLPFLAVTQESVSLVDPMSMDLWTLCPVLLQMMFLTLLVDFVESLNPGGKTFLSWLFSQLVTAAISLSAYLVIMAIFHYLLPCISSKVSVVPVGLAALTFLVMLCAKFIFTVVMESGDPRFKKVYDFFTSHKLGSLLTISSLSFLFFAILFAVILLSGLASLNYGSANGKGLRFILVLILASEHVFAMYYCGKKK